MNSVGEPYWLLLTVTLPQVVLMTIFWRIHRIIGSLLAKSSQATWLVFGLVIALLCLGFTGYAVYAIIRKKSIHYFAGLAMAAAYITWLYLAISNIGGIIPWDIPRWMLFWVAPEMFLITMIVPALAYAMVLLVTSWTPEPEQYKPIWDMAITVALPAVWYLFFNVVLALIRFGPAWTPIFEHVFPIALILSTCVFLFTLSRLAYALLRKSQRVVQIITIPLILVLPIAGLIVNLKMGGIFGDFSSPIYYILSGITGLLLVVPMPKGRWARLVVFAAKSIVLPFTAYFFLVFLPFLPLAIPAILVAGAGFLILSPMLLGFKHVLSLKEDFKALKQSFHGIVPIAVMVGGFLLIPATCYLMAVDDSRQIQAALDSLYTTGYSTNSRFHVTGAAVERVLRNIEANKSGDGLVGLGMGEQTPYLTSLYNWIVLDNLVIAQERVRELRRVFCDTIKEPEIKPSFRGRRFIRTASAQSWVIIKTIKTTTKTNPDNGVYRSRVQLELYNDSTVENQGFAGTIEVPAGCYVSGYDLVVNGHSKKGILADRRAAAWVYQQIVNEQNQRDPGVLLYGTGNKLILRVYPFHNHETRLTGIDLIHESPVLITIGDKTVRLGDVQRAEAEVKRADGAIFIPASLKKTLPKIRRKPVYHFVIDFSQGSREQVATNVRRVEAFMRKHGIEPSTATVTAANFNLTTVPASQSWMRTISGVPTEGGFDLDRAVKAFLVQNYRKRSACYPVIIVVTDNPDHWCLYDNYERWRATFPEGDLYYRLDAGGRLYGLSYLTGETGSHPVDLPQSADEVLVWPGLKNPKAYLADDGIDSVVLEDRVFRPDFIGRNRNPWQNGLTLEAMGTALTLDPSHYQERETALIRQSFKSGVMAQATSFIVLENAAQEAAMREKQAQLLSSKKVVDASEVDDVSEEPKMAEPGFVVIMILALIVGVGWRVWGRWRLNRRVA